MNEGTCTDVATGSACGATQTTGCTCQNVIFYHFANGRFQFDRSTQTCTLL